MSNSQARCLILAFGLCIVTGPALGVVDMKNSNYADGWIDLRIDESNVLHDASGIFTGVWRYYNSRSEHNGMFGFGWCSDFETRLERLADGSLLRKECGAGQETRFTPHEDETARDQLVSNIIEVAANRDDRAIADPQFLARLRSQLFNNPGLLGRWASDYGLSVDFDRKALFRSEAESMTIQILSDYYVLRGRDAKVEIFDSEGRLIEISKAGEDYVKFSYSEGHLTNVVLSSGLSISFLNNSKGNIEQIVSSDGRSAMYEYDDDRNLVAVTNAWNNRYAYEYDENHNLTAVHYPDDTSKFLTYDREIEDLLLSFTDRDGCSEYYSYGIDSKNPTNHHWADAEKVCRGKFKNRARSEFWHSLGSGGVKYLERVRVRSLTDCLDVHYHRTAGRPKLIVQGNGDSAVRRFFDPYGNIVLAFTAQGTYRYTTDHVCRRPSRVDGPISRVWYAYDDACRISLAKRSDGNSFAVSYAQGGQIAVIERGDGARLELSGYSDSDQHQPSIVKFVGVGTIKIQEWPSRTQQISSEAGYKAISRVIELYNDAVEALNPAEGFSRLSLSTSGLPRIWWRPEIGRQCTK